MSSASARLSRLNPGGWARIRQHKWAKIHGHSHAKVLYQQGLAVAVPTGNLGLLLNLLIGAGAACHRLRQYEEAEGYERLASDVAGKSLNPFAKIDAIERLGDAQHRLGRSVEAG